MRITCQSVSQSLIFISAAETRGTGQVKGGRLVLDIEQADKETFHLVATLQSSCVAFVPAHEQSPVMHPAVRVK